MLNHKYAADRRDDAYGDRGGRGVGDHRPRAGSLLILGGTLSLVFALVACEVNMFPEFDSATGTVALESLLRTLVRVKDWGARTAILNLLQELQTPRSTPVIEAAIQTLVQREPFAVQEQQQWFRSFAEQSGCR